MYEGCIFSKSYLIGKPLFENSTSYVYRFDHISLQCGWVTDIYWSFSVATQKQYTAPRVKKNVAVLQCSSLCKDEVCVKNADAVDSEQVFTHKDNQSSGVIYTVAL